MPMSHGWRWLLIGCAAIGLAQTAFAKRPSHAPAKPAQVEAAGPATDSVAEARLLEVYRLMAAGQSREALTQAGNLVQAYPHFQLAQLVYGDLLAARGRPIKAFGDVPPALAAGAAGPLGELRDESRMRLRAHSDRPRPGSIPSQFVTLARSTRHAIAVDASRSRLYLFENRTSGLTLVGDYYTSVGKAGVSKTSQGDQRTPLGVYFITSRLNPTALKDFYGSGALPINYPNVLDARRGKTGNGIWLHGTPPTQFARAPMATDGCLVLSNPDLMHLMETVEVGSTPVVIAAQLQWVDPGSNRRESGTFEETLDAWRQARVEGDLSRVLSFYTRDFNSNGKTLDQWALSVQAELTKIRGRSIELKDVTLLRWTDTADTMVVSLGEVTAGRRSGWIKRQYWSRQGGQWKIFFEGTL